MKYVVDRIEDGVAVLQDEKGVTINHILSNKEKTLKIRENDVVYFDDNLELSIDLDMTVNRRVQIEKKIKNIFK